MDSSHPLVPLLAGAVAALGCAQPTVEFAGAYEAHLAADCSWDGTTGGVPLASGSMNVAVADGYWLVMSLEVGGNDGLGSRDDLLVTEAAFSYACKDTAAKCTGFLAPKPILVPLVFAVSAGRESAVLLPLLTGEAAAALRAWATETPATVIVGVTFQGNYGESETIDFPILVYSRAPDPCPAGTVEKYPTCQKSFGLDGNDEWACEAPQ